jgi:hypothetical protein
LATEVQKVDDADDSGPDAMTRACEAASVSPVASSRPSAKRPMRHEQRKIQKTLEHVRRVKESMGLVFTEAVDRDTYVGHKRVAWQEATEAAEKEGKLDIRHMHLALVAPVHFGDTDVEIERIMQKEAQMFITKRGKDEWCELCECWSNYQHVAGKAHRGRALCHAADSYLAGTPERPRMHTTGCVATNVLTWEALCCYWGPRLITMSQQSKVLVDNRKVVRIKPSEGTGHLVPSSEVMGAKLIFVNYKTGQGKYDSRSVCVFEHQLPWSVPPPLQGEEWWPVVVFALSKQYLKTQRCDDYQDALEVVADSFQDDDYVMIDAPESGAGHPRLAFASCIRQLAGAEVVAWPIRLHPVLRLRGNAPPPPPPPHANEGVFDEPDWVMADAEGPPPEPAPRVPVLRLRGGPAIPDHQPGPAAAMMEEVD